MFYELIEDMTDEEYYSQLFDYVVSHTGHERAFEIVKGETYHQGDGIDALRDFVSLGCHKYVQNRYEIGGVRAFGSALRETVDDLPDREAAAVLEYETNDCLFFGDPSDDRIMRELEVFRVAEDRFDADLTSDIVDLAYSLSESETKLDLLEEREAISGEEWFDRHNELEA